MHTFALSKRTLYNFWVIFNLFGTTRDQTTFRSSVGMPLWNAVSNVFYWLVEIALFESAPTMPKMDAPGIERICCLIKGMYYSIHFLMSSGLDCLPMKICYPRSFTVFLVSFLAFWSSFWPPSESKESFSSDENYSSAATVGLSSSSTQSSLSICMILFFSSLTSSALMCVRFKAAFCFLRSANFSVLSVI